MAETFGIGDIVRLKSGGLDMVVEGFDLQPITPHPHAPERFIRCVWMADGMVQSHAFVAHLLVGEKKTEPEPARAEKVSSKELVAA